VFIQQGPLYQCWGTLHFSSLQGQAQISISPEKKQQINPLVIKDKTLKQQALAGQGEEKKSKTNAPQQPPSLSWKQFTFHLEG
jgi:hypothetical protein